MANQTNFTTNKIYYKQRFKELLNNWGKFAPGTVDEVMTFCDKQFNQLKQASKLKDNEENAYYQRMCSAIITTNFDVSIFKTTIVENDSFIMGAMSKIQKADDRQVEILKNSFDAEKIIRSVVNSQPLTQNMSQSDKEGIINDLTAMSVYFIKKDQIDQLILVHEEKLNIIDLDKTLKTYQINRFDIVFTKAKTMTFDSSVATKELVPHMLKIFREARLYNSGDDPNVCQSEIDELKMIRLSREYFIIKIVYCVLAEYGAVRSKVNPSSNTTKSTSPYGIVDKNLNPLTPGVADSEFIVELLDKLGLIKNNLGKNTFKDYVCSSLRLMHGNKPMIRKKDLNNILNSSGKDFFKRLQKWICRFGFYDLNNFTRTRVEEYVCQRF